MGVSAAGAQASINSKLNVAHSDPTTTARSTGDPWQPAEPTPGHQRYRVRESRSLGTGIIATTERAPLRERLATSVRPKSRLARGSVESKRRTPPPIPPATQVIPVDKTARLSTDAPLSISHGKVARREIPAVEPEQVGMSSLRLERLARLNRRYVDEGLIPGALTAVLRDGKLVHQSVAGTRSVADPAPLPMDAIFRIYSMTKPITVVAAMQLYEQGQFLLTDSVARHIPEFKRMNVLKDGEIVPAKSRMTMQHLLTHTAGFSYGFEPDDPVDKLYREADLWESKNLGEFAAKLARIPLRYEPGVQWHYSVATDLVGLVVERLSGQPLDEYLTEHVFKPLDMVDTSFALPADKTDRLVPMHLRDRNTQKLSLVETSGSAHGARPTPLDNVIAQASRYGRSSVKLVSGGAGLVSTLRDYVRFAEAIRAGGVLDGTRILSPKTVEFMTKNHLQGVLRDGFVGAPLNIVGVSTRGIGFGLGFAVVVDPATNGTMGSPGQLSWEGVAGTSFLIDPEEEIVMVNMMQLMNPLSRLSHGRQVATHQAIVDSKARIEKREFRR